MNGRLGNSMLGYALMLSMKEIYDFRTYLYRRVLSVLKRYFRNIDQIQRVESVCSQNCSWTDYFKSPDKLARDPILSKGNAISYLDDVSKRCIFHDKNII